VSTRVVLADRGPRGEQIYAYATITSWSRCEFVSPHGAGGRTRTGTALCEKVRERIFRNQNRLGVISKGSKAGRPGPKTCSNRGISSMRTSRNSSSAK